ncbi:MAG: type II toxin-antitoxin system HicB family antitoxin [Euryarchaeota archaeon]|nr:type II toxin-antitoxin system HicB family antitoxin [Euryarchaeota archaeon]MBU4339829.1 type II toxin-antitoxin system HicB family antitoxin [Euryarchaeota archaeon]MBU4454451.1 type II toxin-antitoxin system HicB family antitoxin [Euryarchaeota archaeon]
MHFKVVIEEDEEVGGYVVSCPSLPGCFSQGDTTEEALENIKEAIQACIEMGGDRYPDADALEKQTGHAWLHLLVRSIFARIVVVLWDGHNPHDVGQSPSLDTFGNFTPSPLCI